MRNRYQQAAIQEAKDALEAIIETPFNVGHEIIHPQSPRLVVKQGKGQRMLANITWDFPLILAEAREQAATKRVGAGHYSGVRRDENGGDRNWARTVSGYLS